MMAPEHHPLNHVADIGFAGLTGAALIGWVPAATTILAFIYACIRIYETKTVQRLLKRL